MSTTVKDVTSFCDRLWPQETAEDWDAVGLIAGLPEDRVHKILLAVDAVSQTVDEAIAMQADMLLTHHPLLLRGVTTIGGHTYKGALLTRLLRNECALFAAHTNADAPVDGVSDIIAARLGLTEIEPLVAGAAPGAGIGRVGVLAAETTLAKFAASLTEIFPETAGGIKFAGDPAQPVRRVALCGGAGDSLLGNERVLAADVYITSDLRHHPAQEFLEQARIDGPRALIDVAHYAAESLWLETASQQLRAEFPNLEIIVSKTNTDPWHTRVTAA